MANWTLPKGVTTAARKMLDARARDQRVARVAGLSENARHKDAHKGKRCFIVASGPSVKAQDLTKLKEDISISVSNSFVHKDFPIFKPRYHCVPDMLAGHSEYIADQKERFEKWLRTMDASLGESELFLSSGDRSWIESAGVFQKRRVSYLLFDHEWDLLAERGIDLTYIVPGVQSVSVMALQVAFYMGFEKIYLLGCDHDWLLHVGTSAHFYASKEHAVLAGINNSEWAHTSFGNELRASYTLWEQYRQLKSLAEARGISIYNATGGGVLDVFPNVNFESLF